MPFPKTWIEELVVEWLQLEGFLAQSNLPVGVKRQGGRLEADVIGARINQENLQIWHIETGVLAQAQQSIESVQQKFSENVVNSVTNYFKQKFQFSGSNVNYLKMYVATYCPKTTAKALNQYGILIEKAVPFIRKRVFPTIDAWKKNPPHRPRGRCQTVTLPESNWLLQMLDHLAREGLIQPC